MKLKYIGYVASYKILIFAKPLRIMFDIVDGFIRDYNGTKYLAIFSSEKYNAIFNSIRYLVRVKSRIPCTISHNYGEIKIDSDDDFPLEKILTLHNVVILIKSVFNKDRFS